MQMRAFAYIHTRAGPLYVIELVSIVSEQPLCAVYVSLPTFGRGGVEIVDSTLKYPLYPQSHLSAWYGSP